MRPSRAAASAHDALLSRAFERQAATAEILKVIAAAPDNLQPVFEAITSHGGVVNQMVGDGLMAIFDAPLALAEPPLAAVRAALDMQEMIALLNVDRQAQGKPPIRIGVGVATGEMIAGYTGTNQRATYTCVGDTVNLAARLEAHTKAIGRGIAIDGATYDALNDRIPMQRFEPATFKGKSVPTDVYAI